MSANSVSPPASGTCFAQRRDAFAGTRLNELSVCQYELPLRNRASLPSGSMSEPSLRTFERMAKTREPLPRMSNIRSRAPNRSLNAVWLSSSRNWPGNTSTACSSHAAWMSSNAPLPSGALRSTPRTVAPSVASSGSTRTLLAMTFPPEWCGVSDGD